MYTVMFQGTVGTPGRFRGNLFSAVLTIVVPFKFSGTERVCLCVAVWADNPQVLQSVIRVYAIDMV